MKLPKSTLYNLKKWMREKQIAKECPACHSRGAVLWPDAHILPCYGLEKEGKSSNGRIVVVLECSSCGTLRFFSAHALGLAEREEQERNPPSSMLN